MLGKLKKLHSKTFGFHKFKTEKPSNVRPITQFWHT